MRGNTLRMIEHIVSLQQHELWDGTYTLDDLLDIMELIRIRRENETRAAEAVRE